MYRLFSLISYSVMSLLVALLLSSCGGGGGSSTNPQGQGNTQFNLKNTSAADISRVTVASISTNKLISDQSFNCSVNSNCSFKSDVNGPSQLIFYRKNGDVVAAYSNYEVDSEWVDIATSRVMLGIYLFQQLDLLSPDKTSVVAYQLGNYFSQNPSPDGTPDIYQELGQFYRSSVVQGGLASSDFYAKVLSEMGNATVLPAGTVSYASASNFFEAILAFANRNFTIRTAQASLFCSIGANVVNGAGGISSAVGEWTKLMPAKVVAPLLNSIAEIWGGQCDNGAAGINDSLTKISQQLSKIQAQITSLQSEMQVMFTYLAQTNANFASVLTDDKIRPISTAISSYKSLMNNGQYTSLRDYIDKNGGLEYAVTGKGLLVNKTPNAYLTNLFCSNGNSCLSAQVGALESLADPALISNFASSVQNACTSLQAEAERDVLQGLTACNIQILGFTTKLASVLQQANVLIKEEYETLQWYADNGSNADKQFLASSGFLKPADTWANSYSQYAAGKIDIASNSLNQVMVGESSGLYNPIKGLKSSNQALLNSIAGVGCTASGTSEPNIVGWYPNKSKPFIVAVCGSGVASRYYLNDPSSVGLVMGVLVPYSMLNPSSYYNETAVSYLQTTEQLTGNTVGMDLKVSSGANRVGYLDLHMEAQGASASSISSKYEGGLVQLVTTSPFGDRLYFVNNNAPLSYSWIRYTESDRLAPTTGKQGTVSFAWKIRLSQDSGNNASYRFLGVTQGTVTDARNSTKISFDDGPSLGFNASDFARASGGRSYLYMTADGVALR